MTIKTRAGSLMDRLIKYYESNPDEELTMQMICIKFNTNYVAAKSAVERMRNTGDFESAHVIRRRARGIAGAT